VRRRGERGKQVHHTECETDIERCSVRYPAHQGHRDGRTVQVPHALATPRQGEAARGMPAAILVFMSSDLLCYTKENACPMSPRVAQQVATGAAALSGSLQAEGSLHDDEEFMQRVCRVFS
jgi:hypothetical protein